MAAEPEPVEIETDGFCAAIDTSAGAALADPAALFSTVAACAASENVAAPTFGAIVVVASFAVNATAADPALTFVATSVDTEALFAVNANDATLMFGAADPPG